MKIDAQTGQTLLHRCSEALQHLPAQARAALRDYFFEVAANLDPDSPTTWARHYPPRYLGGQGLIVFAGPLAARLSFRGLLILVGHEAAHAVNCAEDSPDSEEAANARLAGWGLDIKELIAEVEAIYAAPE